MINKIKLEKGKRLSTINEIEGGSIILKDVRTPMFQIKYSFDVIESPIVLNRCLRKRLDLWTEKMVLPTDNTFEVDDKSILYTTHHNTRGFEQLFFENITEIDLAFEVEIIPLYEEEELVFEDFSDF